MAAYTIQWIVCGGGGVGEAQGKVGDDWKEVENKDERK